MFASLMGESADQNQKAVLVRSVFGIFGIRIVLDKCLHVLSHFPLFQCLVVRTPWFSIVVWMARDHRSVSRSRCVIDILPDSDLENRRLLEKEERAKRARLQNLETYHG